MNSAGTQTHLDPDESLPGATMTTMTLVVAAIHDESRITMAADTLVTWDDGVRRPPQDSSLAKLAILRSDLAVGVTGCDPHGRLRDVIALRDEPVDVVLEQLKDDTVAGFVVAALGPARLWEVRSGAAYDRTAHQMAWDGEPEAYKEFSKRFTNEWVNTSAANDVPFRVMTAMQALTSFGLVSTVGGITLRVGTTDRGFRFIPDRGFVLGGSAWLIFVGNNPTPGAIGILDVRLGLGQLFPHHAPDDPITVRTTNPSAFVSMAHDHGQTVEYVAWPG